MAKLKDILASPDKNRIGFIREVKAATKYLIDLGGRDILASGPAGYKTEQSVFVQKSDFGWIITGLTQFSTSLIAEFYEITP